MNPIRLLLVLILLMLPMVASAWSALGHRLVAALAATQLTPQARAQVAELLRDEPDPTLPGVANWADELRAKDPGLGKRSAKWHYVNMPEATCEYVASRDCPNGDCVIDAIRTQAAILADRGRSRAARARALKFVVHFVGDVHQPLHASNRKDKGGNGFQVSLRTDIAPEAYVRDKYVDGVMGTNLHSVWDYYLLASAGLKLKPYAARLDARPPRQKKAAQSLDPAAWAGESCRLIDAQQLYPAQHRMDSRYLDAHRALAEQRVRLAADRLAALLNATLTK